MPAQADVSDAKPASPDYSTMIEMGRATYFGGRCLIDAYGRTDLKIRIGSYCSIGRDITFFIAGNHPTHYVSTYPFGLTTYTENWGLDIGKEDYNRSRGDITIGSDVWIGAGVSIMSGVTIGHGAIVGANSMVTKDIPPYAIFCGNPAKCVGYRFSELVIRGLLSVAWWDWADDKIEACAANLACADVDKFLQSHLPREMAAYIDP